MRIFGRKEKIEEPSDMKIEGGTVTLSAEEAQELRDIRAKYETSEQVEAAIALTEQRRTDAEAEAKQLTERLAVMERNSRHSRFVDLATGQGGESDGLPWNGSPDTHVSLLETLADTFGDESDEVSDYIQQQRAVAYQLKSHENIQKVVSGIANRNGDSPDARGAQS